MTDTPQQEAREDATQAAWYAIEEVYYDDKETKDFRLAIQILLTHAWRDKEGRKDGAERAKRALERYLE